MNASQRNQLKAIDRALLALLDERTRLLEQSDAADPARRAAVEDMLRRHTGPMSAAAIRAIFAQIDIQADARNGADLARATARCGDRP